MQTCGTCLWWSPNKPFRRGMTPQYPSRCLHHDVWMHCPAQFGCVHHVGPEALEVNVPQHVPNGELRMTNGEVVNGPMEILIVTHAKDLPWLECCLRSLVKFCTGFQGVTIAHPNHEAHRFAPLLGPAGNVRLHGYDEVPGKGMIQHMVKLAEADQIVPPETKWVLTCDADCIFRMPTTPADYFKNGKPYYLVRSWESLTTEDPNNPGSKCISDCHQWLGPTEAQLGFRPQLYTMCMNTNVFPVEFFGHYRAHIEKLHGKPFADWMLEGRNAFPQDRMDHTAMGAWAYQYMREWWTWIDVEGEPYPADRKQAYWSHGGITPAIRSEIEEILK